jgi:hypothetical protein
MPVEELDEWFKPREFRDRQGAVAKELGSALQGESPAVIDAAQAAVLADASGVEVVHEGEARPGKLSEGLFAQPDVKGRFRSFVVALNFSRSAVWQLSLLCQSCCKYFVFATLSQPSAGSPHSHVLVEPPSMTGAGADRVGAAHCRATSVRAGPQKPAGT